MPPHEILDYDAAGMTMKFQIVFGSDEAVEIFMLIEGGIVRRTFVDFAEAHFSQLALRRADVRGALEAWFAGATSTPIWMSMRDVEQALEAAGIDIEDLSISFPPLRRDAPEIH